MNDFADIVEQLKKRKKYVRYEFQSYGLELANKLGDQQRLSLYMKLAKSEPRELLNQALGLALDAKHRRGRLGDLFLWHLKDLKQAKLKRLFIGLFPQNTKEVNKLHAHAISPLFREFPFSKSFRYVDLDQLHITLFYHEAVPEEHVPALIVLNKELREKYNYPVSLKLEPPRYYFNRLLALTSMDQTVFRSYFTIKKAVSTMELAPYSFYDKKPFFHLTIGRRNRQDMAEAKPKIKESLEEIYAAFDLELAVEPRVVESQLTKNGYRYKILG